jgi:hypothetical protein
MLSFAESFEEADTLEEICYDKNGRFKRDVVPVRMHLGAALIRKEGPWATLLVAVRKRKTPLKEWGDVCWILTKWRKKGGRWHNQVDFHVPPGLFEDLFGQGSLPQQISRRIAQGLIMSTGTVFIDAT